MIKCRLQAIACGVMLLTSAAGVRAADIASARTLYASASYEEALAMLTTIETPENVEQVDQIRALCLLALGRTREAEQSVERIVLHDPAFAIDSADVSPKLVSLFHEVRRRTLPAIARSLYAKAKTSFDNKRWDEAKTEFSRMLAIVDDPDLGDQRAGLTDLRQLGEGFLKLSQAEIEVVAAKVPLPVATSAPDVAPAVPSPSAQSAQAGPAPVPAPESSQPPAAAPSAPNPPGERSGVQPARSAAAPGVGLTTYTAQNQDVAPPVELQRPMPRWSPINRLVAQATYRGLIEIVIDERGMVESASMAKSVTPMYDDLLLRSVRGWRYTPAKKDGKPVRYRQVLEIVLRPSQ